MLPVMWINLFVRVLTVSLLIANLIRRFRRLLFVATITKSLYTLGVLVLGMV